MGIFLLGVLRRGIFRTQRKIFDCIPKRPLFHVKKKRNKLPYIILHDFYIILHNFINCPNFIDSQLTYIIFYTLLPYVCLPSFCQVTFCIGCFRQAFFHLRDIKVVAGRIRQVFI